MDGIFTDFFEEVKTSCVELQFYAWVPWVKYNCNLAFVSQDEMFIQACDSTKNYSPDTRQNICFWKAQK